MRTVIDARRFVIAALALAICFAWTAMPASAAPQLESTTYWSPTNLAPDGSAKFWLQFRNSGPDPVAGPWTLTVDLPPGVTYAGVNTAGGWFNRWGAALPPPFPPSFCAGTPVGASTITCTYTGPTAAPPAPYAPYTSNIGYGVGSPVDPFNQVMFDVAIAEDATEDDFPIEVSISGGGSAPWVEERMVTIDSDAATFGIHHLQSDLLDNSGGLFTDAGGHPDSFRTYFRANIDELRAPGNVSNSFRVIPTGDGPKTVHVQTPPGFVGDPTAVEACPQASFINNPKVDPDPPCAHESQVGYAIVAIPIIGFGRSAVYNLEPPPHLPAQLGFQSPAGPIVLNPTVRSDGDYGLTTTVDSITEGDVLLASEVILWGEPSSPTHDGQRCAQLNTSPRLCVGQAETGLADPTNVPHPFNGPRKAFLSLPTNCFQDQTTKFVMDRWDLPAPAGDLGSSAWTRFETTAPTPTGCNQVDFDPTLDLEPTSRQAGGATGLSAHLHIPRETDSDPDGRVQAHMRNATVTLPEGQVLNPSAADGLAGCLPEQIGLVSSVGASPATQPAFNNVEPTCPKASKIADAMVTTPLLEDPLRGEVFVAQPKLNPFGTTYGIYMVVRDPSVLVKLAGQVIPDQQTGRLTSIFAENPQLPFSDLELDFFHGPRAALTNPQGCGLHNTSYELEGWNGSLVDDVDPLSVDEGCAARGFEPSFTAGSTVPQAAGFSPVKVRLQRQGANQAELGRIDVTMPPGVLAELADVDVCSSAQLAAAANRTGTAARTSPGCPAGSQIGTVTVGAGSGALFYPSLPGTSASGRVFLTDRHAASSTGPPGVPQTVYGIAVEAPAVAGPFDLGNVIVRAALHVDPDTGRAIVVSDPMPRILDGTPLDVRDVRIDIDRPEFTTTPTSCAELQAGSTIHSQDGAAVSRQVRYQVNGCKSLKISPKIGSRFIGRRQTRTGDNPALRVRLRQAPGQSNIRTVQAVLPRSIALDASNAAGDWLCEFEAGQRGDCPARSRIGTAVAHSPLLKRRLAGPVYFVKGVRIDPNTGNRIRTLPTLLVKLQGEAEIHIRARSSVRRGLLVSTFSNVPDAPVSSFSMRIRGGNSRGILAVTGPSYDLCKGRHAIRIATRGQNGKLHRQAVDPKMPCKAKKRKRKKR